MAFNDPQKLLEGHYKEADFDLGLFDALSQAILEKSSSQDELESCDLAYRLTWTVGYLCSAFESGFIEEVDALIGSNDYKLYVYLSRNNELL